MSTPAANKQSSLTGRIRALINAYPRSIWALVLAIFVLWTGRGMVIPFMVIFFTQIVDLPGSTVGAGIAISSLTGIALVTITAGQIDKRGGRPVLMAAVLLMGLSTILMAWAENATMFVLFSLLFYSASQSYWPSIDTVTSSLADRHRVITSMSMVRVANAMGIGFGGFLGGIMVSGGGLSEYRLMYMTGGALTLVSAVVIWLLVPHRKPVRRDDQDAENGGWRAVLSDRTFMYSLVLLFAMVLGFTQVNMSVPPFLRAEAAVSEGFIGSLFLMNTLLVILLQVPIAGRVDRGNPGALLAVAAVFWGLAFALMMLTVQAATAAVAVFIAFTAGELLFMPISAIFAVRLAPEHLRGRYFSLLSMTWGGSFAIATLAAGWVQDASRPILMWPVMIALMLGASTAALRLRSSRRLRPQPEGETAEPVPAGEPAIPTRSAAP